MMEAIPTKPVPSKNIVAGSGTGVPGGTNAPGVVPNEISRLETTGWMPLPFNLSITTHPAKRTRLESTSLFDAGIVVVGLVFYGPKKTSH